MHCHICIWMALASQHRLGAITDLPTSPTPPSMKTVKLPLCSVSRLRNWREAKVSPLYHSHYELKFIITWYASEFHKANGLLVFWEQQPRANTLLWLRLEVEICSFFLVASLLIQTCCVATDSPLLTFGQQVAGQAKQLQWEYYRVHTHAQKSASSDQDQVLLIEVTNEPSCASYLHTYLRQSFLPTSLEYEARTLQSTGDGLYQSLLVAGPTQMFSNTRWYFGLYLESTLTSPIFCNFDVIVHFEGIWPFASIHAFKRSFKLNWAANICWWFSDKVKVAMTNVIYETDPNGVSFYHLPAATEDTSYRVLVNVRNASF